MSRSIDGKRALMKTDDGMFILRTERIEERVMSEANLLSYKHELEHELLRLQNSIKECQSNLEQVQEALGEKTIDKDEI